MIRLEAHDPNRNIHRGYEIVRSNDLFGWTIVELRWGRVGGEMRSKILSAEAPAAADRIVRTALRKRAGAIKRIGVPYREVKK
ncbi:MAG: WGR domain-containing protein [Rhodospirillales bacterium]|jgi:predicted DNA-binding WGR domain protein